MRVLQGVLSVLHEKVLILWGKAVHVSIETLAGQGR